MATSTVTSTATSTATSTITSTATSITTSTATTTRPRTTEHGTNKTSISISQGKNSLQLNRCFTSTIECAADSESPIYI